MTSLDNRSAPIDKMAWPMAKPANHISPMTPDPGFGYLQIDFMDRKELYAEFVASCEKAGVQQGHVPVYTTWSRIWQSDYKHIKILQVTTLDPMFVLWCFLVLSQVLPYLGQDRRWQRPNSCFSAQDA